MAVRLLTLDLVKRDRLDIDRMSHRPVIISLHSGLFNFYRFTKWKQGEDDSYVDRSECTGTQELYKYIAYIKAFIEEFEKVRAKIRKGESTETAEAGVGSGTAFFINNRGN